MNQMTTLQRLVLRSTILLAISGFASIWLFHEAGQQVSTGPQSPLPALLASHIPNPRVVSTRQVLLPAPLYRAKLFNNNPESEDGEHDDSMVVMDKVLVIPKVMLSDPSNHGFG